MGQLWNPAQTCQGKTLYSATRAGRNQAFHVIFLITNAPPRCTAAILVHVLYVVLYVCTLGFSPSAIRGGAAYSNTMHRAVLHQQQ